MPARCFVAALLLALVALPASAQERKRMRAMPRGDATITIDGHLDEPVWATAPEGAGFVTRRPTPGEIPPVQTRWRALYDAEALYVGIWMELLPGETPRALELRRDSFSIFSDDAVTVKVDAARDRRTTVGFAVNPAGTQLDYVAVDNGAQFRNEFDAVWEVETSVTDEAWIAEYRIPVAALGFSDQPGERVIGFNVTRDHNARFATDDWNQLPAEFGAVSALHYGDLEGLADMGGGRPLTLVPYVLATLPRQDTFGPVVGVVRGGGDVRLRIAEDVWSELTLLTDFAQVDIDDAVVNLNRFPLFFPEKRPFFLSGLDVFEFGQQGAAQLFFSRRIGLDDAGAEIPVLGGAKVYGRAGPIGIGFLDVLTADPLTDWGVGRIRYDAGGRAHVGLMSTLRDDVDLPGTSVTLGGDASLRLLDERLQLEGSYALTGVSHEDPPPPEPGEDPVVRGDSTRERGSGFARVRYRSDGFRPEASFLWVGDDFDPDVGFVRRRGVAESTLVLPVVLRPDGMRDVTLTAEGGLDTTDEMSRRVASEVELSAEVAFEAWGFGAEAEWEEDVVDEPFDLLGMVPIEPGAYRGVAMEYWLYASSDNNPYASINYSATAAFFGGVLHAIEASGGLSLGPHVRLTASAAQAVIQLPGIDDIRTLTVNSGLTIAPSTKVAIDTTFQITDVSDSRAADRMALYARLRWRYLPGSDLFLVGRVSDTPVDAPDYRVTLKLSYRYDALL